MVLLMMMLWPGAIWGAEAATTTRPSLERRCQDLSEQWRERFEAETFNVVISPPFVIAGDGSAQQMARYRDKTILAATHALQTMYFEQKPDAPILILLFEKQASYRRLARAWLGDENVPHFGYFRGDNIMLMNVGTGTGTLVHELTHALIKPDFPKVPRWFNEGFASLFEQCSINGDRIVGLANWRLAGLQQAIKEQTLRPLEEMIADERFDHPRRVGINYAQARYLMMYLQERDKLKEYYLRFRDNVADDPSGLASLEKTIAPQTLPEFEKQWREWVLSLTFP